MLTGDSKKFSITLFGLLAVCFVSLIFTSAFLVIVISQDNVNSSTRELLRQKSEVVVNAIVERVTAHRDSAEVLAQRVAQLLADQDDLSVESGDLSKLFRASLAGTPHVSTIGLVDDQFRMFRVFRLPRPGTKSIVKWHKDPGFVRMIREGTTRQRPSWGPLFYSEHSRTTFVNYLHPLKGTPHTLLLSISVNDLSDYLGRLEKDMIGKLFILFDDDQILALPELVRGHGGLDDNRPLPLLKGFSNPILPAIWSDNRLTNLESWFAGALDVRVVKIRGKPYVFLFRTLQGYGSALLSVGTYFALDDVAPQIQRNQTILYAGGGLIIFTLLLALVLSRLVSRPIKNITHAAEHIARLHLDDRAKLPESRIAEVGELTRALRAMISGLRSFEHYVPERLVHRVMEESGAGDINAEEKIVTVIFTDIVGFTGIAESMSASDVVAMLNKHFEIIDACIEAEAGTIDKYIGDSVMAFWGGMDTDDDQAVHACAAALRIEEAVRRNNLLRSAAGESPIHVRIGIHTGAAMVGNIGASARISYTIVGDTVNIAARLQEFSRSVDDPSTEALTVISGEVATRIGGKYRLQGVGEITLRGRHETTKVFRLKDSHLPQVSPETQSSTRSSAAKG